MVLFCEKKTFWPLKGAFFKNPKNYLSPLFFTIVNHFFKLLNNDHYFFENSKKNQELKITNFQIVVAYNKATYPNPCHLCIDTA